MKIECPYWVDANIITGGYCGLRKTTISYGECKHCIANKLNFPQKNKIKGLGDVIAKVATPVARVLKMNCIDPVTKQLKPDSGCSKRKNSINKAIPFK